MHEATFSGKSDAKGRNGYFKLHSADTFILSDGDGGYGLRRIGRRWLRSGALPKTKGNS